MKKILFGIVGIFLTVSMVAGAARAVFFSTATAGGVTFATGDANLQIYNYTTNLGEASWGDTWSPSFNFQNMYPGFEEYQILTLRNKSTSPITLGVTGKLAAGGSGNWNDLKDAVQVKIYYDGSHHTGYHTLTEWSTTGFALPSTALAQYAQKNYRFYVKIDTSVGNEIKGKSLTGLSFEFTGTQTP
jgi:hypothetical protein